MNKSRKYLRKVKMMKVKYFLNCLMGRSHEAYLRKHHIFQEMGEKVLFQPIKLPNETDLIKIHNNVKIASDVTFYTHDVINWMLADMDKTYYYGAKSCIEIHDNVFIGGKSILIGGISIGPNAIVGAGSVVTKDVLPGTIVAGNPARVIGDFESFHQKRKAQYANPKINVLDIACEQFWKDFYDKHKEKQEL